MKINYKTHPALGNLKSIFGFISCCEVDRDRLAPCGADCVHLFRKLTDNFKENIFSLSDPFADSINKADNKIFAPKMHKYLGKKSGTLIFSDTTFFYDIDTNIGLERVFMFEAGRLVFVLSSDDSEPVFLSHSHQKEGKSDLEIIVTICCTLYACLMFIYFADIQTNIVDAKSKVKGVKCEYGKILNELDFKVNFLTCQWFTDLVVSGQFNVRGHFRFQPCGKAFVDKKLIWINEFTKEGYNRKHGKPDDDIT